MLEEDKARPHRPFDGRVPPPNFANIETTRFCNLQCRMCIQFHDGSTVAGPHMDLEQFDRIAESVFPFIDLWQPSVAGEPTMSAGFEHMLEMSARYGVKAEMVTNGTLLTASMIEKLAPNIALLMFSFDGPDAETFEFIRSGASYDRVVANILALRKRCEQLPSGQMPQLGINCTLMERNIRGLPDLVDFAADHLGVEFVSTYHVFPVTEEMKRQSLLHHRELAARSMDEACRRAEARSIALSIAALDQMTAATASSGGSEREWSLHDGVVEGFEAREVNQHRRRRLPTLDHSHPRFEEISARRNAVRARSALPEKRPRDPNAERQEPIWFCSFLWNKVYLHIGGDVRACCVHQAPRPGNLNQQPFEDLWNNQAYRALRQRMVMRDPAPACKGCMHIREITDPVEVDFYLQGMDVPRPEDVAELPDALDPAATDRKRSHEVPAPTIHWQEVRDASHYVVEFSLDHFASTLFTTRDHRPQVKESRYTVPKWAWDHAPVEREIHWRVFAHRTDEVLQVEAGTIQPVTS